MLPLKPFLSTSAVILAIAISLTACGNKEEDASAGSNAVTTESATESGAAEEIRSTVLDTTSGVVDKTTEAATDITEKATEVVESANEVIEAKIVEPSVTSGDEADEQ